MLSSKAEDRQQTLLRQLCVRQGLLSHLQAATTELEQNAALSSSRKAVENEASAAADVARAQAQGLVQKCAVLFALPTAIVKATQAEKAQNPGSN